jgi:hypothetical protein
LRLHPAVSEVVHEAYAGLVSLIENPTNRRVQSMLDEIRVRFDESSAIFDVALSESIEETRRSRSQALAERQVFSSQLETAQSDLSRTVADRDDLAGALAVTQDCLAAVTATRAGLATKFAAESHARCTLENRLRKANGRLGHLEECVAYMADRYSRLHRGSATHRVHRQKGSKSLSELNAIRGSAYFDADYYLEENADVRSAGIDPSLHYLLYGAKEGRNPGPFFSTTQYLKRCPDVAVAGVNPLAHYELFGRSEKRLLSVPLVDGQAKA